MFVTEVPMNRLNVKCMMGCARCQMRACLRLPV